MITRASIIPGKASRSTVLCTSNDRGNSVPVCDVVLFCISQFGACCSWFRCAYSPAGEPLNDAAAGTGTSTKEWIDLVVGEGGVIDWISPGWRGEYKK